MLKLIRSAIPIFCARSEFEEAQNAVEQSQIHWMAILTSFVLDIFLVIFIVVLIKKNITKDLSIMSIDVESFQQEEIGWKQIRTEALMPPENKLILTSMIGTGIQLLVSLLLFTVLGLLYDTNGVEIKHGSLKTIGILIFALTGVFNGYFSAKYYKYLGGKHLALNLASSACLFPVTSSTSIIICFSIRLSIARF